MAARRYGCAAREWYAANRSINVRFARDHWGGRPHFARFWTETVGPTPSACPYPEEAFDLGRLGQRSGLPRPTPRPLQKCCRELDSLTPEKYTSAPSCGSNSVVECNLAKVDVEGSNPFSRSNEKLPSAAFFVWGVEGLRNPGLAPLRALRRHSAPAAAESLCSNPFSRSLFLPNPCRTRVKARRRTGFARQPFPRPVLARPLGARAVRNLPAVSAARPARGREGSQAVSQPRTSAVHILRQHSFCTGGAKCAPLPSGGTD